MSTNNHPMMQCGCAASSHLRDNATGKWDIPYCGTHGCKDLAPFPPLLVGRIAQCAYCKKSRPSDNEALAFFEYRPTRDYDTYYCGCRGWD